MNFDMSYDDLFMNMVYLMAMKSKDESTKLGAIVVDDENTILSTGFNSFPRGINDHDCSRQERPKKYFYFAHAERNSIYNAARNGVSLSGGIMYTNGFPCSSCAIACIQAGIKEVVLDETWDNKNDQKWAEEAIASKEMFEEAGVKIRYWSGKPIQIKRVRHGKEF